MELKVTNYLMDTDEEDANIYETSFVYEPASGFDFLKFKKEDVHTLDFKKIERQGYQRMVSGVWFMPDTKYIRYDKEKGIYTVEFKQEALQSALIKYLKSDYANNVKVEHQGGFLEGFSSIEHWIYNGEGTTSPVFGLTIEDLGYTPDQVKVGTVFKTVYVQDEMFWNEEILTGKVKGFSVGGLFALEEEKVLGTVSFSEVVIPEVVIPEVIAEAIAESPEIIIDENTDEVLVIEETRGESLREEGEVSPTIYVNKEEVTISPTNLESITLQLKEMQEMILSIKNENSLLKTTIELKDTEIATISNEKSKLSNDIEQNTKQVETLKIALKDSPIKTNLAKQTVNTNVVNTSSNENNFTMIGGFKVPVASSNLIQN